MATAETARSLHDFTARTASGEERSLADFRGQVVLLVNTATQCAFTPQLTALEELQRRYADQGFTVLGFPSDQFRQDPGSDADTVRVCTSQYEVSFPLFAKTDVNGPQAPEMWAWLRAQRGGVLGGRIAWNFTKFLLDRDGQVLRRYAPPVPPVRIARRIEAELAAGGTRG